MRLTTLPALMLAAFLAGAAPAAAHRARAADDHDLAANAALKYWQAIALMPALDEKAQTLLAAFDSVPLDAPALALVDASEASLVELRRGAKLARCDWALDYEDGVGMLMPHVAKARDLARLAALHARREFEAGRWDAGTDDAEAILALARHVGTEPTMISILVRYAIEATAVDLLAPYLPELRGRAGAVVAAYESLAPGATFEQAYRSMEKEHTVRWLLDRLREAERRKPGSWRDVWQKTFDAPESRDVAARVTTFEQAVAAISDLLPVCDQLAALVVLPRDEFDARYPGFKAKVKANNPLAGHLLSAPDRVLDARRRNDVRMAMLKAAIAVVRDGPKAVEAINDPAGAGPFEYRARDGGFELTSRLTDRGRPVTLTVGRPKSR